MHRLPVIFCLDRAGVTGPDGASHHGVYDMALMSKVPGMRVLVPSSAQELHQMLHDATTLADEGPVVIRYARGAARQVTEHEVGVGILGRKVLTVADPADAVCVIAIGKMLETAEQAAAAISADGGPAVTVWDARCCAPLDPAMIADAAVHRAVVTIEDGIRDGGIGMAIATDVVRDRWLRAGHTARPPDQVPPARPEGEQHPRSLRARRRRPRHRDPQRLS